MTQNETETSIYLSSSPHFTQGNSTARIMATVLIALLPECIFGVITFGLKALVLILTSVISCVAFEALFQKVTKQKSTISNLSAAVTGVMLALVVSSEVPFWMIILGAFFSIVIAKGLFGGIGSNIFNPALTGRAFLFISFGSAMSKWAVPAGPFATDAISSATTLSAVKSGALVSEPSLILQNFLGNTSGCIGETSALLLILSFIYLMATKIIDWRAPLAMIVTSLAASFIASMIAFGDVACACSDMIFAIFTGGIMFGAVFMVTDYATTPVTKPGRLVFGFGCGLITFLIRQFGGYPEGVMFSILIMNSITPFLNNLTQRKYGYAKSKEAGK